MHFNKDASFKKDYIARIMKMFNSIFNQLYYEKLMKFLYFLKERELSKYITDDRIILIFIATKVYFVLISGHTNKQKPYDSMKCNFGNNETKQTGNLFSEV